MRKYVPSAYMVDVETDEPEFTGLCEYVRADDPLVAAAPELLAALIRMRDEFNSYADCPSKCDAVSMAFQAIEKAGGE